MSETCIRHFRYGIKYPQLEYFLKKVKTFSKFPTSRIYHQCLIMLQKRLKPIKTFSLPNHIQIDITNICNSHCQLCPSGLKYKHPKGSISLSQFKSIVDSVKHCARVIGLFSWGEPFLHKDLPEMVEYLRRYCIITKLSTNIHKYDENIYKRVFNTGMLDLAFSLHGLSQKTYEAYRPGMSYETNLKNMEKIIALREKLNSKDVHFELAFVVTKFNEHEVPELDDFCRQYKIDTLIVFSASLNMRFLLYNKDFSQRKEPNEVTIKRIRSHIEKWQPRNNKYKRPLDEIIFNNPLLLKKSPVLTSCLDPWQIMYINYAGEVSPCCGSYNYETDSMGNVFKDNIESIWNNKKYQSARLHLNKKDPLTKCMCTGCFGEKY